MKINGDRVALWFGIIAIIVLLGLASLSCGRPSNPCSGARIEYLSNTYINNSTVYNYALHTKDTVYLISSTEDKLVVQSKVPIKRE